MEVYLNHVESQYRGREGSTAKVRMAGLLRVRDDAGDMRRHRHLFWLLREEVEAGRRRDGLFGGRAQHEDLPRRNVADSEVIIRLMTVQFTTD